MGEDQYNLNRFLAGQNGSNRYDTALDELQKSDKVTDWMWFVFPQIDGISEELGTTPTETNRKYSSKTLDEARAYLAHPVLGPRLRTCTDAVLDSPAPTALAIINKSVDVKKLRSSMTLFLRADPTDDRYQRVLDKYFDSEPDPITDRILGRARN